MAYAGQFDAEIFVIEAIRSGDKHAFAELVRRQNPFVRSVILGVLGDADRVDDVAQQVWTSFWERIGKLRDPDRWRPWLYRLARNAAIDAGRSKTRRRQFDKEIRVAAGPSPRLSSPDGPLLAEEERARMLAAIEAMPPIYREPFVLKHMNDWSYREIAEAMSIPVDTVETRLVRARRLLREVLKEEA